MILLVDGEVAAQRSDQLFVSRADSIYQYNISPSKLEKGASRNGPFWPGPCTLLRLQRKIYPFLRLLPVRRLQRNHTRLARWYGWRQRGSLRGCSTPIDPRSNTGARGGGPGSLPCCRRRWPHSTGSTHEESVCAKVSLYGVEPPSSAPRGRLVGAARTSRERRAGRGERSRARDTELRRPPCRRAVVSHIWPQLDPPVGRPCTPRSGD